MFFNENWVDYADRHNYLMEASAGVSSHMSHVETTFAFRTRIPDYLWAGVPMIVTEGDSFAELVEQAGLGTEVPTQDVATLEAATETTLFDKSYLDEVRRNVARVREDIYWERTLARLIEFVRTASRAADYAGTRTDLAAMSGDRRKQHGFAHDVRMAWHHLIHAAPKAVLTCMRDRISRLC